MTANSHIFNLLPGYALDCLDEDELILVSEHLAGCAECRAELQGYRSVVNRLALAAPEASPSPALHRRLMSRIQTPSSQPSPGRSSATFARWVMPVWGWASLALVLVLVISNLFLWQRISQLQTPAQSGNLGAITLTGTQAAPEATGLIVLSLDGEYGTLVVDHLPALDSKHQYQLWLIQDDQRTSGAVFSVSDEGYGSVEILSSEPLDSYPAFGISIEPAGGSPGPTGEKVLGGTLN